LTPTTWISAVFAVFLASSMTSYIKFFGVRTRFFGVFDAENAANAGTEERRGEERRGEGRGVVAG
jgi:hypothetical protein